MRRGQGSIMKAIVAKKVKSIKIKQNEPKIMRKINIFESWNCEEFISEVGEDNVFYKKQIINFALQNFLRNKKPVNTFFLKYLNNFNKFNISSLLCAAYYLQSSSIISKGDIRTFIYLYFAFNIISSKYLDDYTLWNKSFIPLWGVSLLQASQLEIFALEQIDYNMSIDGEKIETIIKCISVPSPKLNVENYDV